MGDFFSSKTKTTQEPFEQNPWKPQQGYLKTGFSDAEAAKNKAMGINNGITDFTADMTPEQIAAIRAGTKFSGDFAGKTGNVIDAGASTVDNLRTFGANANSLYNQFGQNRTDQIIGDASRFADNPALQGQIDSAIGDVNRGFQRDLGDINSGAVGTGNMNSTRAGVVESLARDDAMDRAGTISSTMRGQAFDRGLGLASDNINNSNNQQLSANGQLSTSASQGVAAMGDGYGMGAGALGDQAAGFSAFQAQNQAEIDGLRAKGASEQEIVDMYMKTIGGSYGSNGFNSTTTKEPSLFQSLVGGASAIMGGIGSMKGI